MGNFNKFDNSRNRGGGGYNRGGSNRGRSSSERKQLFPATCSDCGKDCEIPFRPTGKHPVYCSNCFKNQGGSQSRSDRKSFDGDRGGSRFDRSSSDRPKKPSGGNTITKAQFDSMTSKLDKIITLLTLAQREESEEKKAKKTAAKKIKEVSEKATKKVVKKVIKKVVKKTVKKAKAPAKKKKVAAKKAKPAVKKKTKAKKK